MAGEIEFWFDFASPYAYLAAQDVDEVAARHGRQVQWRPISLGHVWRALGYADHRVPEAKKRYTRRDVARCAGLADVPFTFPAVFPVDARLARRVCYRLDRADPDLARRFAFAVMCRYWGEGQPIVGADDLTGIARGLRIAPDEIEAAAADDQAKAAVIAATDRAIAEGCCGVPWFQVDGEGFWGHDRLPMIERWLARQKIQ